MVEAVERVKEADVAAKKALVGAQLAARWSAEEEPIVPKQFPMSTKDGHPWFVDVALAEDSDSGESNW